MMAWRRRGRAAEDARMSAELRYHFEQLVREAVAAGMSAQQARRHARLEFGGLDQIEEECRDARGRWLADFVRDLRYAARSLGRSPAFLAASVLLLALGIGANTAIFTLIDAVMLRMLPVEHPERLVHITRLGSEGQPYSVSYQLYLYLRDNLKSIAGATAQYEGTPVVVVGGAEQVVSAAYVSGSHYRLLGIRPAAGRLLGPLDDTIAPVAPAAVISYRYWQRQFGLSSRAIGSTFALESPKRLFTIVGVTPPGYEGISVGSDPDITLPLTMMLSEETRDEPMDNMLDMMGRLAPGATIQQANAELQVLWRGFQQRVAAKLPEGDRADYLRERIAVLRGASGFNSLRDRYGRALLLLMGMVALVLLLACANLSGLLLARAAAREREISIRLAIGASGGRLVRQFLAESFALAALGGGAGLVLARWFSAALVTTMANGKPLVVSTSLDRRVLAFTALVSLLACAIAGLAPGLHALKGALHAGLRQPAAAGGLRLGRGLVVAQLAISMVLVSGGALFAATLVNLYRVDRGLNTSHVLVFTVRASGEYPSARLRAAVTRVLDRVRALPGVARVSAVDVLPISGSLWERDVDVEGYTYRPGESQLSAFNAIAPEYFATVGTPVLSGREFDARDTASSPRAAIVNEAFARSFFGNESPLGRRLTSLKVTYQIVGVVKDAKYTDLRQDVIRTMYIPWTQRTGEEATDFWFLARVSGGDPMRLAGVLQRLTPETDPILRLSTAQPYSTIIDRGIVKERIMAALGGIFGPLALLVAGIGIFGVMAFQVSRRVNEIGIRMALGASRTAVVGMVLRDVARMLALGCPIGAVVALGVTGLTRRMLFGVTATQPGIFLLAATVLGMAAFAAAWLPARRASRVDPLVALRHE
ncbi:MAG TPA: ABC transporter permease [Bryobacteraceae bacterium]|nr:ABC transporter permease [Bryobacteraceae bacterium]